MKFKEIAVAVDAHGNEVLFAIDMNGNLYEQRFRVAKGTSTRRVYWWEPVDYPIGEPPTH